MPVVILFLASSISLFLLLQFLQPLSLFHLGGMLTAFTCRVLALIETERSLSEGESRRFLRLVVPSVRGVSHGLICVLIVVGDNVRFELSRPRDCCLEAGLFPSCQISTAPSSASYQTSSAPFCASCQISETPSAPAS